MDFNVDIHTMIEDQFKRDEELNFEVIDLYLQLPNKFLNKFNHDASELIISTGDMHQLTRDYVAAKHKLKSAKNSREAKKYKTEMKEVVQNVQRDQKAKKDAQEF